MKSLISQADRRIKLYYFFAVVCIIFALFVAQWQIRSQRERANIRATGQRITAVAVSRKEVQYNSTHGRITTKPLVAPLNGTLKKYDSVVVIYDRDNPKRAVLAQDDSAFNITIWIIVAKLTAVACLLLFLASRRGRKLRTSN
jgi:hypothetical protein